MEKPNLKSVKDQKVLAYIEHLEKIAHILLSNSRAKTFVTLRNQVDSWNEQLEIREVEKEHPEDSTKKIKVLAGYVDLFADKDTKDFERVFKYLESADGIEDKLQKMFEKLTPKEQEDSLKLKEGSSAERHIFRKENQA